MIVKRTSKGRGVFAERNYKRGAIVEAAPVIIFDPTEMQESATLAYYMFQWEGTKCALALGTGSLYNHSFRPNLIYLAHIQECRMYFQALRDIKAGDQLTVNYNGDPTDRTPIEFLDQKRAKTARGF